MSKKILFKSEEYPLQFNFLVFKEWEKETGKKLSELGNIGNEAGAVEAVEVLTLLFLAINDACEEQGLTFPYTLKQFIRGVNPNELAELTQLIEVGDGEENKGQPVAKP